jgi:hypothetical protein
MPIYTADLHVYAPLDFAELPFLNFQYVVLDLGFILLAFGQDCATVTLGPRSS